MPRRKNEEIKVYVMNNGPDRNLCLRYFDPKTKKPVVKTAGTRNMKAAQKEAGKWEEELREGKYKPASKTTWAEFRARYETEVVAKTMRDTTELKVSGVFDAVERIIQPDLLSDVTEEEIDDFKRVLSEERTTRQEGDKTVEEIIRRSEQTIRGHLAVLKAGLNWANDKGILNTVPKMEMPSRSGIVMKGRPITLEEFERMLAKVPEVRKRFGDAAEWERLMWGLWWSGLRLDEALHLTWDDIHAPHVDLDGEDSTITIPGEYQKNGEDTVGPIVPEFYEFLVKTPEVDRTGPVFLLPFRRKDSVSKIITAFGEAAGVKVSGGKRTGKTKFASAHDFRRSFGFRWAMLVMPALLQKLMRHASIETTMKYYVGNNAKEMGKAAWRAYRAANPSGENCNTNCNTTPSHP